MGGRVGMETFATESSDLYFSIGREELESGVWGCWQPAAQPCFCRMGLSSACCLCAGSSGRRVVLSSPQESWAGLALLCPQVLPPLLGLCCSFHYLRRKKAAGLAAIPRQIDAAQGKFKFPITAFSLKKKKKKKDLFPL